MSKEKHRPSNIETDLTPDINYGLAAQDYARWRQGFPDEFYDRLKNLHIGKADQKILDIGTGTGLLSRGFAQRGAAVTGLDASQELIREAKLLDKTAGLSTQYHHARAEDTKLKAASYDVISAGTCWHWLERVSVAKECMRLLTRDGRLVIAHLDWLNLPGNVIDITKRVIQKYSAIQHDRPITFQYPDWLTELIDTGFDSYEIFGFNIVMNYTPEAWRGRIRASSLIGPEMDTDTLTRFDNALKHDLEANFPHDMLAVDQRIFTIVLWRR